MKPFFAEGSTISVREFVVGALHKEMGLEASSDPDLLTASAGGRVVTPSGMGIRLVCACATAESTSRNRRTRASTSSMRWSQ